MPIILAIEPTAPTIGFEKKDVTERRIIFSLIMERNFNINHLRLNVCYVKRLYCRAEKSHKI